MLQKNLNDDEIVNLVRLAEHRPISVRFIEFMPFSGNAWKGGSRFVSMRDILRKVTDEFGDTLTYLPKKPSDVSRNYKIDGFKGDFGIIGSMSQPFCSGCNRIRLTADGQLKTCLFSDMSDDFDLKTFIRTHDPTEDEIIEAISDALQLKKASHGGLDFLVKNRTNNRAMVSIGG